MCRDLYRGQTGRTTPKAKRRSEIAWMNAKEMSQENVLEQGHDSSVLHRVHPSGEATAISIRSRGLPVPSFDSHFHGLHTLPELARAERQGMTRRTNQSLPATCLARNYS